MTGAGFTVVTSDDVLFALFVSPVVATVAVFVTLGTAAAATLTVNVIVLVAFDANGPAFVHVTTCTTALQVQPWPVPDTKANPAGNVSLTVIAPVVGIVPAFVTAKE